MPTIKVTHEIDSYIYFDDETKTLISEIGSFEAGNFITYDRAEVDLDTIINQVIDWHNPPGKKELNEDTIESLGELYEILHDAILRIGIMLSTRKYAAGAES